MKLRVSVVEKVIGNRSTIETAISEIYTTMREACSKNFVNFFFKNA